MGGANPNIQATRVQSEQPDFIDIVRDSQQGLISERNRQIDDAYSAKQELSQPKPTEFSGTEKNNFNTGLTPPQEVAYQMYRANLGPQGTDNAYDLRGYFLSNEYMQGDGSHQAGAHFTDYWKKPNHETFSTGSKYSTPEHMGGKWNPNGKGWTYEPSPWMEKDSARMDALSKYMAGEEGKTTLVRRPTLQQQETAYGYPVMDLQDVGIDDSYFKNNPEVAGMAWGGGENGSDPASPRVIVPNPYNEYMADPKKRSGLLTIEAARHLMGEKEYKPQFEIPKEQEEWRKGLGAYATNDLAYKQSVISRIIGGDYVPNATIEQYEEAEKVREMLDSKKK